MSYGNFPFTFGLADTAIIFAIRGKSKSSETLCPVSLSRKGLFRITVNVRHLAEHVQTTHTVTAHEVADIPLKVLGIDPPPARPGSTSRKARTSGR